MEIKVGAIVEYILSEQDAEQINRRRTTGESIRLRMIPPSATWPAGSQAHIGNYANAGEVFPMLIVKVWDKSTGCVNGQVFLDGNDVFWATSVRKGTINGQCDDPLEHWTYPEKTSDTGIGTGPDGIGTPDMP